MIWVLREIIFTGGKYLVIKASLHLSQESILLRGKKKTKFYPRSRKENGNNFNFTISLSTSFFLFYITQFHEFAKMGRGILIRSTRKLIFHNKIQQSGINFTRLVVTHKDLSVVGIAMTKGTRVSRKLRRVSSESYGATSNHLE